MNRPLITLLLTLGSVGMVGTRLQAQTYRIGSDVPFAFHVGNAGCASGSYVVQRGYSDNFDTIRNQDSSCALILGSGSAQLSGPAQAKLVFHKYGDQYFLREVWNGMGTGHALPESKLEQETRKAQVTVQMTSRTVQLASIR